MEDDTQSAAARGLIELGNRLEDRGEVEAALRHYQEAARCAPAYARAQVNIGNALQALGRLDEALAAQRAAVRLDPGLASARFNLGNLYALRGEMGPAERELAEARRLAPTMPNAAIALAHVYESTNRPREAERELRHALQIDARHAGAWHNLRLLLTAQGRADEAQAVAEEAVAANPSSAAAWAGLASQRLHSRRAEEAERLYRRALELDPRSFRTHSELLFALNCRGDLDPHAIFDEHRRFAHAFEPSPNEPSMPAAGSVGAGPILRVGYLSGDFRQHPVGLFILPVLRSHDRSRVEVFCYSNNDVDDAFTATLRAASDHWRQLTGVDDTVAAQMIRDDRIDVLVDLAGHTPNSRLLLFTRRCAPVQATWLGYLNTTGLASADFRICDCHTDPPGTTESLHSERLYRMPRSQWCYAPVVDAPPVEAPHPAQPHRLVFGSFNQLPKVSDTSLDLWCEVLRRLPAAELRLLGVPQGGTARLLLEELSRRGIARQRVWLEPRLDLAGYFAAIGDVDIALDTFPYNGATTTLETLWMGVPLVALRGDRGIARGGVSIMTTLGMPELIAMSATEFVDCNVLLAQDVEWRRELRRTLRRRLRSSPLMDVARFVRDLEQAYRAMTTAGRDGACRA